MRIRGLILGVALVVIPHTAQAACEDILRSVNYDVRRNYAALDSTTIDYATFCSEEYTSNAVRKAGAIEGSYKVISGKAAASKEEIRSHQTKVCNDKFGSEYLKTLNIETSEIVSPEISDILKACYANKDFMLERFLPSDTGLQADIVWRGLDPMFVNPIAQVDQYIDSSGKARPIANCVVSAGAKPLKKRAIVKVNGTVTLSCKRATFYIGEDDDKQLVVPKGNISVQGEHGTVTIPVLEVREHLTPNARLVKMEKERLVIQDLVVQLQKNATSMQAKISALESRKIKIAAQVDGEFIRSNNTTADCGQKAMSSFRYSMAKADYAVRCTTYTATYDD